MHILGIDVGGSGIKGAPVNTDDGTLLAERVRITTPKPATPAAIATAVSELAKHFQWTGPIGCAFPSAIKSGIVLTAANIDKSWIQTDGAALFAAATGCPVTLVNDADAAGLAEIEFGAAKGQRGIVILVTVGTGLGTALFLDGKLLANTELGHLEIRGKDAELRASDAAREREDLGWKDWAERFNEYLLRLEALFWPDLFVIGGGVSKKADKFQSQLTVKTPTKIAALRNEAGIVGAAVVARRALPTG